MALRRAISTCILNGSIQCCSIAAPLHSLSGPARCELIGVAHAPVEWLMRLKEFRKRPRQTIRSGGFICKRYTHRLGTGHWDENYMIKKSCRRHQTISGRRMVPAMLNNHGVLFPSFPNALHSMQILDFLNKCDQLSDYLIGPCQNVGRNAQADLLGGFKVDDELELGRLLDGYVGGFCAF